LPTARFLALGELVGGRCAGLALAGHQHRDAAFRAALLQRSAAAGGAALALVAHGCLAGRELEPVAVVGVHALDATLGFVTGALERALGSILVTAAVVGDEAAGAIVGAFVLGARHAVVAVRILAAFARATIFAAKLPSGGAGAVCTRAAVADGIATGVVVVAIGWLIATRWLVAIA